MPEMYQNAVKLHEVAPEPKDLIYYNAPVILFVIGPAGHAVSCALACENIMIAAVALGLGSCYSGFGSLVNSNTEIVQALELKENERIYGPIALGYPKVDPDPRVVKALEDIRQKKKSTRGKMDLEDDCTLCP